jgi:hypothetical protein
MAGAVGFANAAYIANGAPLWPAPQRVLGMASSLEVEVFYST